jgi:hypothetical protein
MRKSEFERIVNKTFLDLEAKYGFKKTETIFRTRGVAVRYQNPTTEVVLNYEIGQGLARLVAGGIGGERIPNSRGSIFSA